MKTPGLHLEEEEIVLPAPASFGRPGADMAPGAAPPSSSTNDDASVSTSSFSGTRVQCAQKNKTTPPTHKKLHLAVGALQVKGVEVDSDTDVMVNDGLDNHTTRNAATEESLLNEDDVEARLEQQRKVDAETHQTYIVAEVVDDSKLCGVQKKVWMIALIVILLMGVGTALGITQASKNTETKTIPSSDQMSRNVFQKLEPSIIRIEADRIPFEDPLSPQSRAMDWLLADTFSLSEHRETVEILERYVLAVLYYSTNGPNWKLAELSFRDGISACDWNNGLTHDHDEARGIYCSGKSTVQRVLLSSVGLTGTIPWELNLLGDLIEITVNHNALRGTLPFDFTKLSNLQALLVWGNSLRGSLPIHLPLSLRLLDFSSNLMSGTIPSEWGVNLPDITYISLFENDLVGTIPSELGLLTALEYLYIYTNRVTGVLPSELGLLTNLVEFKVNSNELSGTVPTELGQLTTLRELYIYINRFTGVLPSELGLLTDLVEFAASSNEFTGTMPTEFAQLQKLENFTFYENFLTGSVNSTLCTSIDRWTMLEGNCLAIDDGSVEIECSCCTYCCSADGVCEAVDSM